MIFERRENMKFKNLVIAGAALLVVYKIGMMSGYSKCFDQFMDKYGKELLEKHDEIVCKLKIGPDSTFIKSKTSK